MIRARTVLLGVAAAGAALGASYALAIRPWWRSWGVDPTEAEVALPGDDLVADATVVETRGVEIGAPPDAVWPWLIQMGYDRAGWYSYDVVDMKGGSADRIVPELQSLAAGDLVPNSPETAFVVRALDPGRSLVLYADDATVQEQVAAARARKEAGEPIEKTPANLKAAGRVMPSMPDFAASWAFVLTPLGDGRRTRLVERFRVRMPAPEGPAANVMGGAFGFGVFAMTRKQMLGIRDRAEAALIAAGISAEFAGRAPAATPDAPAATPDDPAKKPARKRAARATTTTAEAPEPEGAEAASRAPAEDASSS